jgi:hypothetical protein
MNDTARLIARLATQAPPVRRIASPLRRSLGWLAVATSVIAIVAVLHGPRPGWLAALSAPPVALEWIASLATGVLAAYAAFQVSVPGRPMSWAWLPVPAFLVWLGALGWGCLSDVQQFGARALSFDGDVRECAWTITLIGAPLGLVLLRMVRHAGVVRPAPTAALAALGAASLAAGGVSLIHEGENALMVLLWHLGAVAALSGLGWLSSRRMFAWLDAPAR